MISEAEAALLKLAKTENDWWGETAPLGPNDGDMDAMNGDFDTTDK